MRTDLGTVVAVEDNRYAVVLRHQSGVLGPSDGPEDGRLLPGVLDSLPRQEGGSTVGELNDYRGVDISGGLQDSVDGGG